jgi:DNA-binding winged helix-turn-helix (wHTH) protein
MLDGGWRFGPYELDVWTGRLMRGRRVVPVTDIEIKLLAVLAENGGEVVLREPLSSAVWSSRMTDDNVLTTNICRLRQELGTEIIPPGARGGYRLGCPVEPLGTEEEFGALRLCNRFIKAEDKRQRMPDTEWDAAYLGSADEVRASLDWALEKPERKHIAIRLAGASGRIWERLSAVPEGRRYLDSAVELIDDDVRRVDVARLLYRTGILWREADRRRALELFNRAAALYRRLGDKATLGDVLGVIGDAQLFLGNHSEAILALKDAEKLLALTDQSKALVNVLNGLGILASMSKLPLEAIHYFMRARDLARMLDDTLREHIIVLNIAELEFGEGAVDRAIRRAQEAVQGLSDTPAAYRVRPLVNLAIYEAVAGNPRKSRQAAAEALPLAAAEGGHWLRLCLQAWVFVAAHAGLFAEAATLQGFVDAQFDKIGEVKGIAEQQLCDRLSRKLSDRLAGDSLKVWHREGATWTEAYAVSWVQANLAKSAARSRSPKRT